MTPGNERIPSHSGGIEAASSYCEVIAAALSERQGILGAVLEELGRRSELLAGIAALLVETLRSGHKVLVAGNGGSAAEAQHFAAELVGRFKRERQPFAALALSADSSVVTALANDYGYEEVFARQITGLGQPGDLLVAFSTSGESENLVRAAAAAHDRQMAVVAVTGERPNRLEQAADLALRAPAPDTATVQELHMVVSHLICDIVERELCQEEGRS